MNMLRRVARLEHRDGRALDYDPAAVETFMEALRNALTERGVDADLVIRDNNEIRLEGDSAQYIGTLSALREVSHLIAAIGKPIEMVFP